MGTYQYSTAPVSVPVHTVEHQYIQYCIQMSNSQDAIMAPPARRRKYEASFKLKVVNFAMEHNNCAAARQYGVTEKMVRDWKANEKALKSMARGKCALRRGTPHWPELEKHVADMVNEHRQNGYVVTRNKICLSALQWAKSNPDHSNRFKATVSWSANVGFVIPGIGSLSQEFPLGAAKPPPSAIIEVIFIALSQHLSIYRNFD
ncbi:hypothetical protein Chor_010176 [Crotalus horridus]